jgi:hypothetical protein
MINSENLQNHSPVTSALSRSVNNDILIINNIFIIIIEFGFCMISRIVKAEVCVILPKPKAEVDYTIRGLDNCFDLD